MPEGGRGQFGSDGGVHGGREAEVWVRNQGEWGDWYDRDVWDGGMAMVTYWAGR